MMCTGTMYILQFGKSVNIYLLYPGLKITAGHWTMSGQDDYFSGQNLCLAVILTGHIRCFQKGTFTLFLENINIYIH